MTEQTTPQTWLITGCSTGFGREIAQLVLDRGHNAVITARDTAKIEDLARAGADRAMVAALDVTKPAQVREVIAAAEAKFGAVDVLVNNAGYGYFAAVEEGEDDQARAMFEANFFGLVDMVKAVLPGMRARKSGHIINISSVGGLVGFPGTGYYAATKFAVEGISESLSKELAPLGIRVTIVEPGPFRTDWAGRSLQRSRIEIADYEETAHARYRMTSGYSGKQPGDPARAAEAILKVVESQSPPLHLVLGRPGLEFVRTKLNELQHDIATWEDTTLEADFPEARRAG